MCKRMFNVLEIDYDVLLGDKISVEYYIVIPLLVSIFVEKCLTRKYTKVYWISLCGFYFIFA